MPIEYEDRSKIPVEDWSEDRLNQPRIPRPPEKEIKRLPPRRPEIDRRPRLIIDDYDPADSHQNPGKPERKAPAGPTIIKL